MREEPRIASLSLVFQSSSDQEFIELARPVYFCNDERAAFKCEINLKLGSALVEEMSYQACRQQK